ncbi:MAG: AraC family transcriptional regulator [Pseudomonadota bacterium]
MNGDWITRADMADAMARHYNSEVTERLGHDWRRLNTVTITQRDTSIVGDGLDFHLLELCLDGVHEIDVSTEMEMGDHGLFSVRPETLNYTQPEARCHCDLEGHARLQQIYIDDAVFREMVPGLTKGDPEQFKTLGFQALHEPRLRKLALSLLEEARNPGAGGDLYAEAIAQQIALIILRRRLAGTLKDPRTYRLDPTQIAKLQDLIEANLDAPLGLDLLSAEVGMDTFSFSRAFREATGIAPHQFVIQRRISRVKALLAHTGDPLADVAYATGFASQSHMTATFSKHVGMPPGAYRKAVTG